MSLVRRASLADAPLLAALHARCFAQAWDAASFARLMDRRGAIGLLAGETLPVSFILAQVAADECEILSLGTAPEARRRSFARALILAAAEEAQPLGAGAMFLEVAEDNAAARALYGGLGFTVLGRRPAYYRGGDGRAADAISLRAPLPLNANPPTVPAH